MSSLLVGSVGVGLGILAAGALINVGFRILGRFQAK